ASFRVLFNSYYNTVGAQHPRPQRGLLTRPGLSTVQAWRRYVDEHMFETIRRHEHDAKLVSLLELGINHEQQHQELILMDLQHLFWCNPLCPAYVQGSEAPSRRPPTPLSWEHFEGGRVRIG